MRYDFFSGLFWLCLGLLFSLWSACYKIGSLLEPGPGFLPLILGFLLIFLSLILLGQAKMSSRALQGVIPFVLPRGWEKVAYSVLIVLLATFVLETIGYRLTFFFLLILLIRGAGGLRWRTTLLMAFFSVLGIYLIFVLLLKKPLPDGLLGI